MTIEQLAAYLLSAMTAWVPIKDHVLVGEAQEVVEARYVSIAKDIATVALDDNEKPIFDGSDGKEKTALLVASLESFESNFNARVIDGREKGDHGAAFCGMQIHPELGIFLTQDGYGYVGWQDKKWREEHADDIITGDALLADHKLCIRTGLHMMRDSFKQVHHLGIYTGEGALGGWKSKNRIERAKRWLKDHPFHDPQEI